MPSAGRLDRTATPAFVAGECGRGAIAASLGIAETLDVADSLAWTVRTQNSVEARGEALRAAIADLEAAVDARHAAAAQKYLKQALEALHELSDCHSRGEWSQDEWTDEDVGLWIAHMGARNAAHHSSSGVVTLHSQGSTAVRLTWELEAASVASLRSTRQAMSTADVWPADRFCRLFVASPRVSLPGAPSSQLDELATLLTRSKQTRTRAETSLSYKRSLSGTRERRSLMPAAGPRTERLAGPTPPAG